MVLNLLVIVLNTINFDDYFYRSIINVKFLQKLKIDYLTPLIPKYKNDIKKFNEEKRKIEYELG